MSIKKYQCRYVNNGINFEKDHVEICCKMPNQRSEDLVLIKNYAGGQIDWDSLFKYKAKIREELKQGKVSPQCNGCFYLKEIAEDNDIKIRDNFDTIVLNHFERCNSRCFYCTKVHEPKPMPDYSFLPIFKDMLDKKLVHDNIYIFFGGGEPTILSEFEELLELFFKNNISNCIIHSSGIKYSPALAKGLKYEEFEVITSIDAGSSETYEKIKNVKCFDQVCENLKKYVQESTIEGNVKSKYIIIEGINDNFQEIDKWYNISTKTIGVKSIILDIEFDCFAKNSSNMPSHIIDMIKYVKHMAERDNISLHFYDQALQVMTAIK